MLVEVSCDRFLEDGVARPPIRFHSGLNVVLGDSNATNSIGKSTFLMILDFVFGGFDYIEKSKDVQREIGPHDIRFVFSFDGCEFYFMRNTARPNIVLLCDERYVPNTEMKVDEYCVWLKDRYRMVHVESSFRQAVSGYLRIYQRENYNEVLPLRSFANETLGQSIERLLRLFGMYARLEENARTAARAKEESDVFGKSISLGFVRSVLSKKEYRASRAEASKMREELASLKNEIEHCGLTEIEAKNLKEIKQILRDLVRRRTHLENLLEHMPNVGGVNPPVGEKELLAIQRFFPKVDIKSLSEIESFHNRLNEILYKEVICERNVWEKELSEVNERIANLNKSLEEIETDHIISPVIDAYYKKERQIKDLTDACDNFENMVRLRARKKQTRLEYNTNAAASLGQVQSLLSKRMRELNTIVYSADRSSPEIHIPSTTTYEFTTPADTGTGTACKGMVLLDLALLSETELPLFIHDSFFLKQIGDCPLEKILGLYDRGPKQVIIALDKADSYPQDAVEILERKKVIYLSDNSKALFGRSWAIRARGV